MTQHNLLIQAADSLAQLAGRIEAWRDGSKKSRRMPEELWQAAMELSKVYSIHHVSQALRINYKNLKKRAHAQNKKNLPAVKAHPPLKFIELGIESPSSIPECTVEMEDGSGAKMRIHLRGATDLDLYGLGRAFWGKPS